MTDTDALVDTTSESKPVAQPIQCDLLVVGGGAAGLSAAVTAAFHGLNVIVAEKAATLGGATAWSGGWMWAPLNPLSQAAGIVEDIDGPRTYLEHALGAMLKPDEWGLFSERVILHGRRVCDAKKPRCGDCVLNDFCPSAFKV